MLNFSATFLHRLIAHGLGQLVLKCWAKIQRSSREPCKLNTRGYEKLAFSTNISLYFENCRRYGHSYNGRRIGTHMRSIEWSYSQWPWVTLNLDFKVMIFWMSSNSKMVQDRAIVTTADQYKVVYDLSIGAIFNDLGWPLTQISRARHYSTFNISVISLHCIIIIIIIIISTFINSARVTQCHNGAGWRQRYRSTPCPHKKVPLIFSQ